LLLIPSTRITTPPIRATAASGADFLQEVVPILIDLVRAPVAGTGGWAIAVPNLDAGSMRHPRDRGRGGWGWWSWALPLLLCQIFWGTVSVGAVFAPVHLVDVKAKLNDCVTRVKVNGKWNYNAPHGDGSRCDPAIEEWDVSRVTSLNNLFNDKRGFNQDLSKWDVSRVTDMAQTFQNARLFTSNLTAWDVSKVTTFASMFNAALVFNSDLSNWDFGNALRMDLMFFIARAFNSDVSNWAVSKVTNMEGVFSIPSATNTILYPIRSMFNQSAWCSSSWHKHGTAVGIDLPPGNRMFCCNAGHVLDNVDPLAKDASGVSWAINACPKCPMGQYTDKVNLMSSCTPAPRDTFVPADGLTVATNCSTNSFTNPPNTAQCEICPAGKKMIRGTLATTCQHCDAGKFQENSGNGKHF